jgi:hypothetical protein
MANTFNGIGTTFYGQSQFKSDGSFVTTKWFVIGFFPVLPLASLRVQYLGTCGIPFISRTSSFDVVEELPIDWLQVLKTWGYTISIIALVLGVVSSAKPPAFKILVCTIGILVEPVRNSV